MVMRMETSCVSRADEQHPNDLVFNADVDLNLEDEWLRCLTPDGVKLDDLTPSLTPEGVKVEDLTPSLTPEVVKDVVTYMQGQQTKEIDSVGLDITPDLTDHGSTEKTNEALESSGTLSNVSGFDHELDELCHSYNQLDSPLYTSSPKVQVEDRQRWLERKTDSSPALSLDSAIGDDSSCDNWSDIDTSPCSSGHRHLPWPGLQANTKDRPASTAGPLKRPKNGFIRFAMAHRREVADAHPHMDNREISRMLGVKWRKLDNKGKEVYEHEFQEEMAARKREYPHWNYGARRPGPDIIASEPIPTRLRPRDKLKRKFFPLEIPKLGRPYVRRKSKLSPLIQPLPDNWVQCDRCNKWRRLSRKIRPSCLPDYWYCENNSPPYNHCHAAEECDEADIDLYQGQDDLYDDIPVVIYDDIADIVNGNYDDMPYGLGNYDDMPQPELPMSEELKGTTVDLSYSAVPMWSGMGQEKAPDYYLNSGEMLDRSVPKADSLLTKPVQEDMHGGELFSSNNYMNPDMEFPFQTMWNSPVTQDVTMDTVTKTIPASWQPALCTTEVNIPTSGNSRAHIARSDAYSSNWNTLSSMMPLQPVAGLMDRGINNARQVAALENIQSTTVEILPTSAVPREVPSVSYILANTGQVITYCGTAPDSASGTADNTSAFPVPMYLVQNNHMVPNPLSLHGKDPSNAGTPEDMASWVARSKSVGVKQEVENLPNV